MTYELNVRCPDNEDARDITSLDLYVLDERLENTEVTPVTYKSIDGS